jgi:ERCC4-type nuclease
MQHSYIQLKIDSRERDLIRKIKMLIKTVSKYNHINMVVEPLTVGDVVFFNLKTNSDKIIIERKSTSDLMSSIRDGRYEEQSYRLSGSLHSNHDIMYLIEGNISKYRGFIESNVTDDKPKYNKWGKGRYISKGSNAQQKSSIPDGVCAFVLDNNATDKTTETQKKTTTTLGLSLNPDLAASSSDIDAPTSDQQLIYSALFSLNFNKGFSVMRTDSLNETATFICQAFIKCEKTAHEQHKQSSKSDDQPSSTNYIDVVHRIKKDNITSNNIGELMLCQIPGISSVSAIAIMRAFGTFPALIHALETDSEKLNDIRIEDAGGKRRKINKTLIPKIRDMLCINNTKDINPLLMCP